MSEPNEPDEPAGDRATMRPSRRAENSDVTEADGIELVTDHSVARAPRDVEGRHGVHRLPTIGHFGPYDIVGRLALGGMAEVLLAREETDAGARFLVIKRILPEYERDASFVEMFLDEARLMMRLSHPAICHVYRFGQHEGAHIIAMEWVDGVSLGKLIRRARKHGGLSVPVACKIAAQVAEALDHAHHATSEDGKPLQIVHRDVTPDNIMISYEGAVRLLDFGIARAETRSHRTQAGVVKGKFAYMAPEQCRGQALDARADVFALGVCLYESLTSQPLYRRETEFETMDMIVRQPVPTLSDRIPNPPAELERIIAKCLAKEPGDRFASAAALSEALDRFLIANGELVPTRRMKELLDKLFPDEKHRGPALQTTPFGSSFHASTPARPVPAQPLAIDVQPSSMPIEDALDQALPWSAVSSAPPPPTGPPLSRKPAPLDAPPRKSSAAGSGSTRTGLVAALIVVALCALGWWVWGRDTNRNGYGDGPAPVLTGSVAMSSTPPGATLSIDDREVGTTPITVPDLHTGSHRVRLVLAGYRMNEGLVEIRAGQTREVHQSLDAVSASSESISTGRLTLTSDPVAQVFLGERALGRTPLHDVELPSGVVRLDFETVDGVHHRRGVLVRAHDRTSTHVDVSGPN